MMVEDLKMFRCIVGHEQYRTLHKEDGPELFCLWPEYHEGERVHCGLSCYEVKDKNEGMDE